MGKVVLAEDQPGLRKIASTVLSKAGFEVEAAENGLDALKKIDEIGLENVSVVLSDVDMPRMGGLKMIELLRKKPGSEHIKIVLWTSSAQRDTFLNAQEIGIDGGLATLKSTRRIR